MKVVDLEVREDSVSGELGLCLVDLIRMDDMPTVDTDGIQIAHDLIEHQNGVRAIGSVHDELQALGAIWFVRGQHGYLRRNDPGYYTPEQNLGSDVARQALDFGWHGSLGGIIPRNRAGDCEEVFQEILEYGRQSYRQEVKYDEAPAYDPREYFEAVVPLLRMGYRKARRRFPDANVANTMFFSIQEAVQGCHVEFEGQRFKLRYSWRSAQCWEDYESEW